MICTPQSPWLNPAGKAAVFLVDNRSKLERQIAVRWIESTRPASRDSEQNLQIVYLDGWAQRRHSEPVDQLVDILSGQGERAYFVPIRVLWFPRKKHGEQRARLTDILMGDPRQPSGLRQRWIYRREPDRCHLVAAAGSDTRDLVVRYARAVENESPHHPLPDRVDKVGCTARAEFILRQAILALERAERRQRGARYKVPRLIADEVLTRPDFARQLRNVASSENITMDDARKYAASCLKEMAADHRTFFLDMMVALSRFLYRRGFDSQIQYLQEDVVRIRELTQQHSVVFLMTHKSYLDGCVMASLVYELDLPPLHLFGGINLDFFPAGTFARRSGTIFIRRSFQDDRIYKLVIRSYIQYLVEKRFPLNWAFEGTRSRTGKLMPPKYGLLRYVMDGALHAKDSSLQLVPVSIAYDQLPDVGDYIKEQRGATKRKESLGWFRRYVSGLSKPYGKIHVRFGRQIDAIEFINADSGTSAIPDHIDDLGIQKLAFQVAVEANRVTPVTVTALITFVLLAEGDKALTEKELLYELKDLASLIAKMRLPKISDFDIEDPDIVLQNLQALTKNQILLCYDEGAEPVYAISRDSKVAAAYYRNTVIHFFVNGAISELALAKAARQPRKSAINGLHAEALRLRDLLKFDFFFAGKTTFLDEIDHELDLRFDGWRDVLAQGENRAVSLRPAYTFVSRGTLRPFVEAYRVAAEVLVVAKEEELQNVKLLTKKCVSLGRQMMLQQRIAGEDAVNSFYFENGLRLATSRGLLNSGASEERTTFATEMAELCSRLDIIAARVKSRRVESGWHQPHGDSGLIRASLD